MIPTGFVRMAARIAVQNRPVVQVHNSGLDSTSPCWDA
jgi:hypothetical protein